MLRLTWKVGRLKGPTLAFERALRMQLSVPVPAAGPVTVTLCTLPLDPKTTVAREEAV